MVTQELIAILTAYRDGECDESAIDATLAPARRPAWYPPEQRLVVATPRKRGRRGGRRAGAGRPRGRSRHPYREWERLASLPTLTLSEQAELQQFTAALCDLGKGRFMDDPADYEIRLRDGRMGVKVRSCVPPCFIAEGYAAWRNACRERSRENWRIR